VDNNTTVHILKEGMDTIITNDKKMSLLIDVALKGEKYLAEHNGNIDLDDDNAIEALVWNDLQSETFN
jgi:hypothetical protein